MSKRTRRSFTADQRPPPHSSTRCRERRGELGRMSSGTGGATVAEVAFACTDRNLVREWRDENPERGANRYAAALILPPLFKAVSVSRPLWIWLRGGWASRQRWRPGARPHRRGCERVDRRSRLGAVVAYRRFGASWDRDADPVVVGRTRLKFSTLMRRGCDGGMSGVWTFGRGGADDPCLAPGDHCPSHFLAIASPRVPPVPIRPAPYVAARCAAPS